MPGKKRKSSQTSGNKSQAKPKGKPEAKKDPSSQPGMEESGATDWTSPARLLPVMALSALVVFIVIALVIKEKDPTEKADSTDTGNPSSGTNEIVNLQGQQTVANGGSLTENSGKSEKPAEREFSEEMVPDLINEGTELLGQGRIDEALYIFENAAQFEVEYEDLYFNYAIALNKKGDEEKAVEMYRKALEIWPEYSEALNNLANIYMRQNRIDEAIPMLEKAVQEFPEQNYPKGYNNLGKAYARSGDIGKAISNFTRAIELDPAYIDAHINLGTALFEQRRFQEAANQFQLALRINPNNPLAISRLQMVRQYLTPATP